MQVKNTSIEEILSRLNIAALNDMQQQTITAAAENDNVILKAATGTGKTLAFLLPLLALLDNAKNTTQALIVVPSRELALQIESVVKKMGTGLKVTCCYGGHLRETEENNLIQPPALIVGTAGRLADHIRRGNITVDTITTLVLDEFDKSLELGFTEEMAFIIGSLPNLKRRILTSATEAVDIPDYVGVRNAVQLHFATDDAIDPTKLAVQTVASPTRDKAETLFRLICSVGNRSAIVFCNHRDTVNATSEFLTENGIVNVAYHGAMEQQERDAALCRFRNGSADVLVTTDLAARGLDIPNIRYIIHYHLPATEEIFTHRNGRTARMDATGTVILIIGPEEYLPSYIGEGVEELEMPEETVLPEKPKWTTLFIGAGKKDKVNKVDIVGFLGHKGGLKKEDIGLIEVKDFFAFVAIRKVKVPGVLTAIKGEKIKNKNVKIDVAR